MMRSTWMMAVFTFWISGCQTVSIFRSDRYLALETPSALKNMSTAAIKDLITEFLADGDGNRAANVFTAVTAESREELLPFAWKVAAEKPGPDIKSAISGRLAMVMAIEGHNRPVLPEVVAAITANKLAEAYPLIRNSFIKTSDELYFNAMIELAPEAAADDAMKVLAAVSEKPELLRRMLKHLTRYPPSMINPEFRNLFPLLSSRDGNVRQLATNILRSRIKHHPETFAFIASKTKAPEQAALLDSLEADHAQSDQSITRFLMRLRETTPLPEIRARIQLATP